MSALGIGRVSHRVAQAVALAVALTITVADVPEAGALWSASTAPGGVGQAVARSMTPGQQPLAAARPSTGDTVVVSWASSTGAPVEGYELRAYDAVTDEPRVVGGTCAGLVIATTCTDGDAPDGQWSYTVTPRRAGWSGSESARSTATWVDTVAPTVEIVFPEAGGIYNEASWDAGCPSPGACGSGDDVGSGLVSGGVTARQVSTGLYWDGTAFASSVEVLLEPGTTGWDFPIGNFPVDGVYTMEAMATDAVGNTTFESATFTIDREGPALPAAFPVEGGVYNTDSWNAGCPNPGFCGTGDEVTDIVAAEISVRQVGSELYWDGTAFASATEVLFLITDPAGAAFPVTNFPDDGSYTVRGALTDSAHNTVSVATTFRIDRSPPTVTPIFPLPGGAYNAAMWDAGCAALFGGPGLCGVGSDESGPMSSSLISIRDVTTGLYWDGTAFATPFEQRFDITGVGFLSFPSSNFLDDGSYAVRVVVRDRAGNATSLAATMTIDRTAPALDLAFPADGGTYNTATWNAGCPLSGVCGTTSDPTSGVASTRLSIRQGSGNYWNGSAFASTAEVFVSVASGEDLPFPAANFPADGNYTIGVLSNDFAGNTATVSATFTIDRTAPTAALTFPVNGGTYNTTGWNAGCSTAGFCGTTSDASGLPSGQVSIRQGTGNYWNGTAFASATEVFQPFTPTGGTPFPVANFATDGTYTVRLVATDSSSNTASSSSTFGINRAESGYRSFVLSDSPTAYWRLGESSGTTAVDERGTSNGTYATGSTLGQPSAMIGDPNTAVALNGSTGRVVVPAGAAGTNITENLSVEAWIKPNATQPGFARVVSRYNSGNVQYMLAYDTAGKNMRFLLDVTSGRVTAFSGADLRDGLWHHVVGTWDGATARLYIDGVLAASGTGSGAVLLADTTTMIGADATGSPSFFSGVVDETALYDDALTSAQILTHYQRGSLHRPTATVTFPAQGARYNTTSWNAGCSTAICGTAADADGSVASVAVSIRRDSTGLFWNGSSFASATPVLLPATGTTNWALPFAASAFPGTGSYIVTVTATDDHANTGGVTRSFVVDRTPPAAAITFPAAGVTYNAASWNAGCASKICGTASDDSGTVASVTVSIRQGTGNYWDGSAFASTTEMLLPATGTPNWARAFSAASFPANGTYTVHTVATDLAGNATTTSRTFDIG